MSQWRAAQWVFLRRLLETRRLNLSALACLSINPWQAPAAQVNMFSCFSACLFTFLHCSHVSKPRLAEFPLVLKRCRALEGQTVITLHCGDEQLLQPLKSALSCHNFAHFAWQTRRNTHVGTVTTAWLVTLELPPPPGLTPSPLTSAPFALCVMQTSVYLLLRWPSDSLTRRFLISDLWDGRHQFPVQED